MADFYDRAEDRNGSFMLGLITGAVLGAGLGLLLAPKSGAELRSQLTSRAGDLADRAAEGYQRASDVAADLADRGRNVARDAYDRARDAYDRTADAATRAVDQG